MMQRCALCLTLALWFALPGWGLNRGLGDPQAEVDRQTPLSTVQGFLKFAHAGDYATAAHYLWLDHLPPQDQSVQGPKLARHLRFVLDHQPWLDLTRISKNPEGDPDKRNSDDLGFIPLHKVKVPIRVVRVHSGSADVWVFDRETVRAIEGLYEEYGPPLGDRLPDWLTSRTVGDMELWQWVGLLAVAVLALILGWLGERVLLSLTRRMTRFTRLQWDDALVDAGRVTLRVPLFALVLWLGAGTLLLPPDAQNGVDLVSQSLAIFAFARFSVRFINEGSKTLRRRLELERDPFRARGIETQVTILRRILVIGVYVLAGALLLLQFKAVRSLGVSLLASAGVAGLVIGFAAQKPLSALLAGIQLSITQPIRMGDLVVVEGESGTIEEIRLTYVVIRVWDLRRLVIPINYFLEKPFQNWSKSGTDLLGAVTLQLDYTADIEALRAEVKRILESEARALWDGKLQSVQVVEATDRTLTVRVLLSARDSSASWDLRCLMRERLILFLRQHPRWFPLQRTLPWPQESYPPPSPQDPVTAERLAARPPGSGRA
jgi:small-conductance mechanosensitive channel